MVLLLSLWGVKGWHAVPYGVLQAWRTIRAASPDDVLEQVRGIFPDTAHDAGSRMIPAGEESLRAAWSDTRHRARDRAHTAKVARLNYADGSVYDVTVHWPGRTCGPDCLETGAGDRDDSHDACPARDHAWACPPGV